MNDREQMIRQIREALQRSASPRMHMLLLVAFAAAVGFLVSFVLLKLGVTFMAARYLLAVLTAYIAFLGLLGLWLRRFRLRDGKPRANNWNFNFDISDVPLGDFFGNANSPDVAPVRFGGGGGFGGGGASGSWGQSLSNSPMVAQSAVSTPSSGGSDWDFDIDALWLLVAAVLTAIAFSVVIYVVFIAPELLAEVLLDAGLATGLYHGLRRSAGRPWTETALRHTFFPVCLVAMLLAFAGLVTQAVYPDASSIGVAVHHMLASSHHQVNGR